MKTSSLEDIKRALTPLVKQHAFLKLDKPITLTSGKTSGVYFDAKQITLFPDRAILFARAILKLADLNQIDCVGGLTIGADPIVMAVSLMAWIDQQKPLPAFIARKEAKKHGLQKMIEGYELKKGDRVLVVDDVVTTAKSTLQAIKIIEDCQGIVQQVTCLVDREQGGAEALAKYHFTPVFRRSELENS
ncbi:MAG: orotate phosphoribosyltransferase [Candidatus Omnitrophica bacterium CG11_big_fil_rev_8_21_14_0_20_45_26]|uniref:Orotate phosphoribosyltransferase n=1 Tax=Candidatus Abzuiibacterium crystallinum TaxID=1974748 RepID=A0A2H0LQ73_9BACT|nr:MAG: orotate phosphoribosyltransferase [Candidatus Omnitrophica bacterium CG11_big_fil_rev_8_21_14_0_20_45_26]PIW63992.1 MAG: orotate phosphoribosyltransferase [Candidatus Omnitrophica bacterium CG12_big_fil_rev_8_21_14_0_65_45_16]